MIQITKIKCFALECESSVKFSESIELKNMIKNLLIELVIFPKENEYPEICYNLIKDFYTKNFNFETGRLYNLGPFLNNVKLLLLDMHPIHYKNLQ